MRADLIKWQQQGVITLSQVALPDASGPLPLDEPTMQWTFRRWNPDSPLRRAALAGLSYLQSQGAELDDIDLSGSRLCTPRRMAGHRSEPLWWINWKWQGYHGIPYCLRGGKAWLEVVGPTRTRPLTALLIQPGPMASNFRD